MGGAKRQVSKPERTTAPKALEQPKPAKVTAEGVETREVIAALQLMGCDLAQGYHVAKPLAVDKLIEFLDAWAIDLPVETESRLSA